LADPPLACETAPVGLLTEVEYKSTMAVPAVAVDAEAGLPSTFWTYIEAIAQEDFDGHDFSEGVVTNAWHSSEGRFEHVLIRCETPNVFLVIVLDLTEQEVYGHHLLDLNVLYGLT
jgi:hypothetical protein